MTFLTPLILLITTSLPILTSAQIHPALTRLHRRQTISPDPILTTSTTTKTTTETLERIAIWTTLPIAQQTADPLCFNEADPDAGIDNHCVCGTEGGDYITLPNIQSPKATVTGVDGGLVVNASDYNPCGWTLITVTEILGTGGVVVGTATAGEGWNSTGSDGAVVTSPCTNSDSGGGNVAPAWKGRRGMV